MTKYIGNKMATMDTSYKKSVWLIGVIGFSILHVVLSEERSATICRQESNAEGDVIVKCSCPSTEGTLIVRDERLVVGGSGEINATLPSNTTHWSLGGCQAVHLSGPTLATFPALHTLHLHDTTVIHLGYDFFMQNNTPLQALKLSNSSFSELEDFINIHAHKIQVITLDNMIMNGTFKLLIATQEGIIMDRIAITNSHIDVLGEINISSRYVKEFVLANNIISNILTSAIVHDSSHTLIKDNTIANLCFLAFDTTSKNLTLTGNSIQNLALEGLVINNATTLIITSNSFHHIERFGLAWLRSKDQKGSMVFTHNHFYEHGNGSLIFYFNVYNKNLVVNSNTLHATSCNCNILRNMTESNDTVPIGFKMDIFHTFKSTSTCQDGMGKETNMTSLCHEDVTTGEWNIAFFTIVSVTVFGIMLMFLVRYYYRGRYKRLIQDKDEDHEYMIGDWIDDNE